MDTAPKTRRDLNTETEGLLVKWREDKDLEARNRVIELWLPQIQELARKAWLKAPYLVDPEDLTSVGVIGLLRAMGGYCPETGVSFWTYASKRVYGIQVDWLRHCSPIPRTQKGRLEVGQFDQHHLYDIVMGSYWDSGYARMDDRDEVACLLRGLSPIEQSILGLSYGWGCAMRKIGWYLGISESRVCQLRSRAVKKIRAKIPLFSPE